MVNWLAFTDAGLSQSTALAMKMGKEIRKGQVLCRTSKPTQTIRWRPNSPATTNGFCGASTREVPQLGVCTEILSAICTLSKLTKRRSGWLLFSPTIGGASNLASEVNQAGFAV